MDIELLTIQVLGTDGTSYSPMLVDGESVELVEYSYVSSRMGTTSLSGELRHRCCLDGEWTGREFVDFRGVRLFLDHRPGSRKDNTDERYVHTLEFRAGRDILLSGVYFCDAVASGAASAGKPQSNSYDVKFFGTLDEFVQRFNDVLSYRGLSSRFSVSLEAGVVGTTESLEVSFSDATLFEALRKAVEVWEVPFYFVGDSAVFGNADSQSLVGVEYGGEKELLSVSMNPRGEKIVTRISGSGGSDNVPYYYPNPSPKGTLGVGGTASGVTVVDQAKFARAVGLSDVLTYMGREAVFGGAELVFGGQTAQSAAGGVTAVVQDVLLDAGLPFAVSVSGDVSDGFDRWLRVLLYANVGNTEQIPGSTTLYYYKSYYDQGSYKYEYVSREGSEVAAKGFSLSVDRVEVSFSLSGVRETKAVDAYVCAYDEPELSPEDAGVYPERRLRSVSVDMAALVSSLPAGADLTSLTVRVVGRLAPRVLWQVKNGSRYDWAQFLCETMSVTGAFDPCGWYRGDEPIGDDLSVVGLSQSGSPVEGTTITQVVTGYVTPTGRLMPSIYRTSGGASRFYDALNNTYVDPETGDYYEFENEYDALSPHEHVEDFDDVVPSIRNLQDGQGNPLNVLNDVWFDDGYNTRDVLADGETLKYQWFFVKLKPLGFNLFDCAIEDGEMAVVMSDGPCAGCHFKILVTTAGKNPVQKNANGTLKKEDGFGVIDPGNLQPSQQDTTSNAVWVALYLDDSTFGGAEAEYGVMPAYDKASGAGPKPGAGDSYTLENILLPAAFFTAAEQELDRRLVAFMAEHNADKYDPAVTFSRVWLAQHPSVRAALSERSRLSLTYDGTVYSPLYVSQFTLNVKEGEALPEILVETADVVEARSSGLDDRIDSAVSRAMGVVQGQGGEEAREADGRYLRKDAEDAAKEKIVFEKGLEVGGYKPGLGGIGGTIYTNSAGEAIAEVDFLTVRRKATFTQVEVDALRKVSGTILLSLAEMTCSAVEEVSGGWKCWFKSDAADGSALENGFAVGDQAVCRTFMNNDTHYYWRLVTAVGADYIVLSSSDCDAGSDAPAVGDVIVQLGNRSDASRQSAQVLDCYGAESPSYRVYAGVNSYVLSGKEIFGVVYRETSAGSGVYAPHFFNYGSMYLGGTGVSDDYLSFVPGTGMTIRASVVFKQGQVIPGLSDLDYLKTALPLDEDATLISGGLILSKVIALRDAQNNIKSGINGDTTLSSIAAWYGGPMADKEATPTPASYAASLFRFDGSGYLANGNIHWDNQGYGGIPGITWSRAGNQDVITIGADVRLASSGDTVTSLLSAMQQLPQTYVDFTSAQTISGFKTFTSGIQIGDAVLTWVEGTGGADGYLRISKAIVTLGDQIVVSGTPGGGGGGGGSSYLNGLLDVSVASRASGDLLQYNGTLWVNVPSSSVGVTTDATQSAHGLMSAADKTKLDGIEAGANNYIHPTGGANVTITAANGKVLSAITVNNLGHVTSVSSKTLAAADIPSLTKSKISDFPTTWALANITGADDLKLIEALTGAGLLRRKANNTWELDTNTYITGNQTITISGDVSGSGTTAISATIGQGKVTNAMLAGSIANGKLANSSITINGSSTSLGGSFNTASITAGTAGTSSATSGLSIAIPYVTLNAYGIATGYGTHTHAISASDITTAIGSTTYAPYYSAGYVKKDGDTMSGSLTIEKTGGGLTIRGERLNANANGGYIYLAARNYNGDRNGCKIASVYPGSGGYDIQDLVFYSSNNLAGDASPIWVEAMRIKADGTTNVSKSLILSDSILRTFSATDQNEGIRFVGGNNDNYLFTVASSSTTPNVITYGYGLKYFGSGTGVANALQLLAGNQSGSPVIALAFNQNGQVGVKTDADTNYALKINGAAYADSIKIGGATITWNSTDGYLHIDQPLVTAGDQIVISGTPGGGGGGSSSLASLTDVSLTNPENKDLLQYNGTTWVNVAATSVGRIYTAGTGISISSANVISVDANTYQPLDPDLTAIAAISSGTGLLKRTSSGGTITWTIDTSAYLTSVTLASGTNNGTLKLTVNGTATDNIAVKGLGSMAYETATNYVPTTRTVNSKALSSNITLTLDDIGDGSTRKLSNYVTAVTYSSEQLHVTKNGTTTDTTIAYATTAKRLKRYAGTDASGGYDLNTMLDGGGITSQYNASNRWANGPTNMSYGGVAQINPNTSETLAVQLAWDIVQSSQETGKLWWRDKGITSSTYWWGSWHLIYDDTSLTKSVITGLLDAGDGTYLNLTGGTMTGDIKMTNGEFINAASGYAMLGIGAGGTTFYCGPGNEISGSFLIRSGNIDLTHAKAGTNYKIWDASNSNLSTVSWAANDITAAGSVTASGAGSFDTITLTSTSAVAHLAFSRGGYNYIAAPSGGSIGFVPNGLAMSAANSRLLVSDTDVAITKASGGARLAIQGTASNGAAGEIWFRARSSSFNGIRIIGLQGASSSNANDRIALEIQAANGTTSSDVTWKRALRVTYGANIIVGASGATSTFTQYGNMTINGSITSTGDQVVSSDATLKTNWRGLCYGVEDIAKATAGVFDWKDGRGSSAGTIAQDWKKLVPELVHGEEGSMTLAYGQVAMLNTILLARHESEQDNDIRALKIKVAELEQEVERLRMN